LSAVTNVFNDLAKRIEKGKDIIDKLCIKVIVYFGGEKGSKVSDWVIIMIFTGIYI
jgi:hypothetical protein